MDGGESEGFRDGEDSVDGIAEEGDGVVDGGPGPFFTESADVEDAGGDSDGCAGYASCDGKLERRIG